MQKHVFRVHRKTQMSHLTHLSHSGSLHGQKDSFFTYFWVILSVYWPTMAQMSQMTHLGFSVYKKYVFRVCFESPFTRMISSLKYKWPPGIISKNHRPLHKTHSFGIYAWYFICVIVFTTEILHLPLLIKDISFCYFRLKTLVVLQNSLRPWWI